MCSSSPICIIRCILAWSGLHLHLRLRRRPQSLLTRANPRDSIPFHSIPVGGVQEKSHEQHLKIWGEQHWVELQVAGCERGGCGRWKSHYCCNGNRQPAISSSGKLRWQLSCSPAGPFGFGFGFWNSKEQLRLLLLLLMLMMLPLLLVLQLQLQLLMMLLLLADDAAPKHVLAVMALHLLKAFVRAGHAPFPQLLHLQLHLPASASNPKIPLPAAQLSHWLNP